MAPACRGENFEGFGTLGAEAEHRVLPAPVFGHSPEHWKTGKPCEFSFIPYLLRNCPKLRKIPSVSIAHSAMRKLAGVCPLLTHAAFVADESLRGTKQIERPPFEEPPPVAIDFEVSDGGEEPAASPAKVEDDLAAKRKKTATLPELTEDQFQEIERLCSGNELFVTDNVGFSRLQHISFRKYDWMAPISFANFASLKTLSLYRVFLHPVIAWPPAMRDLLIADCQSLPEFASEWASCFFGCKFLSSIKIDSTKFGMSVGDLQTFFQRLPVSLDSLDTDFSICSEVSTLQTPTELTLSHPRLRRITLKGLPGMTTSKLEIKFCHLPRLCSVESEAAGVHPESSISKSVQNASTASPLMMRRFKVRNIAFGTHGSLPLEAIFLKMKNIAMMDLPGVSHDQILAISQLRQLRSLLMWQTTITDDSAEILCKSLPHLVGISITGAPGIKGTKWAKHDKMSFLFLAGIGPQLLGAKADSTVESSLKHMVFDPSNLPALRILLLSNIPCLKSLKLSGLTVLTQIHIMSLARIDSISVQDCETLSFALFSNIESKVSNLNISECDLLQQLHLTTVRLESKKSLRVDATQLSMLSWRLVRFAGKKKSTLQFLHKLVSESKVLQLLNLDSPPHDYEEDFVRALFEVCPSLTVVMRGPICQLRNSDASSNNDAKTSRFVQVPKFMFADFIR